MGISSSLPNNEGEFYRKIISPSKKAEGGSVGLNQKSRIITKIEWQYLWEAFLNSSFPSFQVSLAEAKDVIREAAKIQKNHHFQLKKFVGGPSTDSPPVEKDPAVPDNVTNSVASNLSLSKEEKESLEQEMKDYFSLMSDLSSSSFSASETDEQTNKDKTPASAKGTVDILSLCSSMLFFSSDILIEKKVEQLFHWIQLDPSENEFFFNDFSITLKSFEKGISYCFSENALSQQALDILSSQWFTLMTSSLSAGKASKDGIYSLPVSKNLFFDFCTNRGYVVRKILENLSEINIKVDKNLILDEIKLKKDEKVGDSLLDLEATGGDEWLANPAWKKTAEKLIPDDVQKKWKDTKPAGNLYLDWVHGYRGYDCRNNVYLLPDASSSSSSYYSLFHAAGLVIVQKNENNAAENTKKQKQFFFNEHDDDVTAITILPKYSSSASSSTSLIASGEIGKSPSVYVYSFDHNTCTFDIISVLRGFLTKGVSQLAFTPDGKFLFTISIEYSVAIYCIDPQSPKCGKMIASAQGPKGKILQMISIPDADSISGSSSIKAYYFLSTGEKNMVKWTFTPSSSSLTFANTNMSKHKNKTFLSLSALNFTGDALATSSDGSLFIVSSKNALTQVGGDKDAEINPHKNFSLNASWSCPEKNYVLTGDKAGRVAFWTFNGSSLNFVFDFFIGKFENADISSRYIKDSFHPSEASSKEFSPQVTSGSPIRALFMCPNRSKILIGSQTCELSSLTLKNFEYTTKLIDSTLDVEYQTLLRGHFQGEVWGLSPKINTNSDDPHLFATTGDDRTLRLWNLETHSQVGITTLPSQSRCCCFSPCGGYIAVGMGTGSTKGKLVKPEDRRVSIYRVEKKSPTSYGFLHILDINDAKNWISVVKYSPDGSLLAVGSRDNNIYIYSVDTQYKLKYKLTKHSAGITHFDFSTCGKYLQSACLAYEILFFDLTRGTQITSFTGSGSNKLTTKNLASHNSNTKSIKKGAASTKTSRTAATKGSTTTKKTSTSNTSSVNIKDDVSWATWTLSIGWPVLGIWESNMDGSDINSVDRSPSNKFIATSDDFGTVKIFNYPALLPPPPAVPAKSTKDKAALPSAMNNAYKGHSSHVTNVKWIPYTNTSTSDYFLISVGGEDKGVFQWRMQVDSDSKVTTSQVSYENQESTQTDPMFDLLDTFPSGGDEFMAVKPWVGAIVKPTPWLTPNNIEKKNGYISSLNSYFKAHTNAYDSLLKSNFSIPPLMTNPNIYSELRKTCKELNSSIKEYGLTDPSPPSDNELELEWVYGYRGYDVRNNIAYLHYPLGIDNQDFGGSNINTSRCILYYTAAIAILLDPVNKIQKFYRGHDDDIVAMGVTTNFTYLKLNNQVPNDQLIQYPHQHSHVGVALIATAQQGPGGKINVWLSSTLETISALSTKQKNIVLINFSTDGKYIISMSGGAGGDHSVVVSDWKTQSILSNTKVDACTVHTMCPVFNFFTPAKSSSTTVTVKGSKGKKASPAPPAPVVTNNCKNNFFVGGDKILRLWSVDGRNPTSTKYTTSGGGKQAFKLQQFLSSVEIQGNIYVGSENGSIYVIPVGGKNVTNSINHEGKSGAITAISSAYCRNPSSDEGKCYLLSGAKDGSIAIWDANVEIGKVISKKIFQFNIKDIGIDDIVSKQIMALSAHPFAFTNTTDSELLLLVGTRGCDLLEVKVNLNEKTASLYRDDLLVLQQSIASTQTTTKSKNYPSNIQEEVKKSSPLTNPMCGIIQRGHCNDELWGLATHPFLPQYTTVGDDKTMRVFNLYEKTVINITPLGHMARAIAYHPDGNYVVVGFGGRVGRGKETGSGFVRIYSMNDPEDNIIDKSIGYVGNTTLLNAYKSLESQYASTPSKSKSKQEPASNKSKWFSYVEANLDSLPEQKSLKPRKVLIERKDAKQWISDVKFSGNGKTVVVGAHDCKIYIYDFVPPSDNKACSLSLRSTFTKHNSVINHFDISSDNRFLMSNCAAYELLFCDLKSGKQLTSATELRDVDWASITCTMMWGVQGVWDDNPSFDGSDINAMSRSNGGNLLAMGDDRGKVCLYRYPVVPNEAPVTKSKDKTETLTRKLEYGGHSSHVMNVRWTVGDECLISVGGNDKCILQWRHKTITPSEEVVQDVTTDNEEDVDIESKTDDEEEDSPKKNEKKKVDEISSMDLLDLLPTGGDEVGCVKPWLGSIKDPSIQPKTSSKKPNVSIALSSVIGFNRPQSLGSIDLKGIPSQYCSLSYTQGGTHVAYPVATLGVLTPSNLCGKQKSESNSASPQRFLNGHDSIVLSMTVSPDGRFIATGQSVPNLAYVENKKSEGGTKEAKSKKGKGKICIWSASSMNTDIPKNTIGSDFQLLCVIPGGPESFIGGVCMLKFNHSGDKLAAVSQDGDYTHSVWSDNGGCWSRVIEDASSKGDKQMPRFLQWLQTPHIVSGGGNILSKFALEGGRLIRKTVRVSGNGVTSGGYTCLGEYPLSNSPTASWDIVVGSTSGDLIIPRDSGSSLAKKEAHSKGVTALTVTSPITSLSKFRLIATTGKDGYLKFWASESSSGAQSSAASTSLDLKIIVDLSAAANSFNSFLIDPKAIYALATPPLIQIDSKVLTIALGSLSGEVVELNVALPSTISGSVADNSKASSSAPTSLISSGSSGASSVIAMKTLVASHYKGELWGLASHPTISNIFATVGDDATLRIWKISPSETDSNLQRDICKVIQVIKLPRASRCVDWHPSGMFITVGFVQKVVAKNSKKKASAASAKSSNGFGKEFDTCGCALIALNNDFLNPLDGKSDGDIRYIPFALNPAPNSKKVDPFPTINQIKFNPAGSRIAVAANNSKIYGYSLVSSSEDGESDMNASITVASAPVFIFDKHTSGISQFDWSLDGTYIQSNDKGGELLFYNTLNKKQETPSKLADLNNCLTSLSTKAPGDDYSKFDTNALTLRGGNTNGVLNPTQWASQTCIYGWPIQGIWSPNVYDGFSSVMAVDRSGDKSLNFLYNPESTLVETADISKDSSTLSSNSRIVSTVSSGCSLKLFRYPCIDPTSASINIQAHSSMITNVKWVSSDHLVTISGDQSIYVWTVTRL